MLQTDASVTICPLDLAPAQRVRQIRVETDVFAKTRDDLVFCKPAQACWHWSAMVECLASSAQNPSYWDVSRAGQAIPPCSDQAISLRRRRLRDPMVARDDPLELAGSHLRHRGRLRRAPDPRAGGRHQHRRD